jgi:hypothetical protein
VLEDDDPIPIYKRGLWFDGHGKFLKLLQLQLNTDFTLMFWVHPMEPYNLMTISSLMTLSWSEGALDFKMFDELG